AALCTSTGSLRRMRRFLLAKGISTPETGHADYVRGSPETGTALDSLGSVLSMISRAAARTRQGDHAERRMMRCVALSVPALDDRVPHCWIRVYPAMSSLPRSALVTPPCRLSFAGVENSG